MTNFQTGLGTLVFGVIVGLFIGYTIDKEKVKAFQIEARESRMELAECKTTVGVYNDFFKKGEH